MILRWPISVMTAACAAGCASGSAGKPPTVAPVKEVPTVQSFGVVPAYEAVSAGGHEVFLSRALRDIVPGSYQVQLAGVETRTLLSRVSWDDQQDWTSALKQAIARYPGLTVDIAAGSRLVLIRQVAPVAQAPAETLDSLKQAAPPLPGTARKGSAPKAGKAPGAMPPASADPVPPPSLRVAWVDRPDSPTAQRDRPDVHVKPESALRPAVLRLGTGPSPAIDVAQAASPGPQQSSGPAASWELTVNDRTLKTALERWARQAGWQLLWELRVDYPLQANATLSGSFEDAVSHVVRDMGQADVPIRAVFYMGNKVLRIVARGME